MSNYRFGPSTAPDAFSPPVGINPAKAFLDKKVVRSFLKTIGKQFFTVTFEKADGSLRTMNCRKGVKKHLKGGTSTIKHKKNLVSVYDVKSRGYRCFDVTRVLDIKAQNATLQVTLVPSNKAPVAPTVMSIPTKPKRVLPAMTPNIQVAVDQIWAPRRGGEARKVIEVASKATAGGFNTDYVMLHSSIKKSRVSLARFYKDYYCVSFSAPASPTQTPTTPTQTPTTPTQASIQPKLKNRIAIALDESGSMGHLTSKVVSLFSETMKTLLDENKDNQTEITLVRFGCAPQHGRYGSGEVQTSVLNKPIEELKNTTVMQTYQPYGNTPLWDGVAQAIRDIDDGKAHPETSFVVFVLTDGGENGSKMSGESFTKLLKEKQATDRWTFAFLLPPSDVESFKARKVVPEGNIQGWSDIKAAEVAASAGMRTFFAQRRAGRTSTKNFFTADLSHVTDKDLKSLKDVSDKVKIWNVEKEMAIKDFVESKNKGVYIKGNGFYALTKKETVQDYKRILLMKKENGLLGDKVYDNVRGLLGMPITGDTEVVPGNLGNYVVFIESTSPNRRVVRGTPFIYVKDGQVL